MAKQITLQSAEIREVILRPDDTVPLTVLYQIKDDAGNVVFTKRVQVKREDMHQQATTALTQLITRITERIISLEL